MNLCESEVSLVYKVRSRRLCLLKTRVGLMEKPQEGSSDYCRSQHRGCCR